MLDISMVQHWLPSHVTTTLHIFRKDSDGFTRSELSPSTHCRRYQRLFSSSTGQTSTIVAGYQRLSEKRASTSSFGAKARRIESEGFILSSVSPSPHLRQ